MVWPTCRAKLLTVAAHAICAPKAVTHRGSQSRISGRLMQATGMRAMHGRPVKITFRGDIRNPINGTPHAR